MRDDGRSGKKGYGDRHAFLAATPTRGAAPLATGKGGYAAVVVGLALVPAAPAEVVGGPAPLAVTGGAACLPAVAAAAAVGGLVVAPVGIKGAQLGGRRRREVFVIDRDGRFDLLVVHRRKRARLSPVRALERMVQARANLGPVDASGDVGVRQVEDAEVATFGGSLGEVRGDGGGFGYDGGIGGGRDLGDGSCENRRGKEKEAGSELHDELRNEIRVGRSRDTELDSVARQAA